MTRTQQIAPIASRLLFALGASVMLAIGVSATANAQGLVQGVQKGAREGNKAAGPIGGVLGGAIGGVVGAVGGVVGAVTGGNSNQKGAPAQPAAKQDAAKDTAKSDGSKSDASKSKSAKAAKRQKQTAVLTQTRAPQLTAEQIVTSSDANTERIKKELNLTREQAKPSHGVNSAMQYH